jgi:thimet oligopeptidase
VTDWNLRSLDLPVVSGDWAAYIRTWTQSNLATVESVTAALLDGTLRTPDEVLALVNDLDRALNNAGGLASLLAEVHADETVRTLAEDSLQRAVKAGIDRGLNRELFEVLKSVDASRLEADARRVLEKTLREFRRAGVALDEADQGRLRVISDRSTVIDQEFSRGIRDDVRSIRITPDRLDGLPADFIAEHPAGDDGLVTITTDYPDIIPFRQFATDAEARREIQIESLNRGWPDNDELLGELLALRDEQAKLLGYASWPAFDTEVKMVASSEAEAEFIEKLRDAASAAGHRDRDILLARLQRDQPSATTVDAADSSFYTELIRRESFDVDSQELRPYFEFEKVRQGLLDVTGRLFGVTYQRVENAPTWHEDVDVYDVLDDTRDGALIGRIHLDLHPREGKFKHAAQFDITAGIVDVQLAEGALVCNLPRGLMDHVNLVTLFHEFGHLVHHLLANSQRFAALAGIQTEWDFVEAPSQMLEEWAWDADVLRTFATNAAGEPIPIELVGRMRAAHEFGKGIQVAVQNFYSAVAYRLHSDIPADRTAEVARLQDEYSVFPYVPDTHFQANFGHLTGYSSAYYTYLWSLVIAKDLFSAFDPAELFDPAIARRYRDLVLAPGGSKDAAQLIREFLGRDYSFDAFAKWLDT